MKNRFVFARFLYALSLFLSKHNTNLAIKIGSGSYQNTLKITVYEDPEGLEFWGMLYHMIWGKSLSWEASHYALSHYDQHMFCQRIIGDIEREFGLKVTNNVKKVIETEV